jgi:hypothetical protein
LFAEHGLAYQKRYSFGSKVANRFGQNAAPHCKCVIGLDAANKFAGFLRELRLVIGRLVISPAHSRMACLLTFPFSISALAQCRFQMESFMNFQSTILRSLVTLLICALAHGANVGSIDTNFGGVLNAGRIRIPFDLGGTLTDTPKTVRVLASGQIVAIGYAGLVSGRNLAVSVRKSDGSADITVAPNGQYTVAASGGALAPNGPIAIAPGGDYYVVGLGGSGNSSLVVWHHALNGALLDGPYTLTAANVQLNGDDALVDRFGQLVISGTLKPIGGSDAATDGFVTRMTPQGQIDSSFGVRQITFEGAARDDAYRITEYGDGGYMVCGRVGDFDGSFLGFGLARLNADGSFNTGFSGDGLLVDFLTVNGSGVNAGCTDVEVATPSGSFRYILATGRAILPAVFIRNVVVAYAANGTRSQSFGSNGLVSVAFGSDLDSVIGFPVLALGRNVDDLGRIYVGSSGNFTGSPAERIGIARLGSGGQPDLGFGDLGGAMLIGMSFPAIGGVARNLFVTGITPHPNGLVALGAISLDAQNFDFVLSKLVGDIMFKDGYE